MKDAEPESGPANDRAHKYVIKGMPRSVPCSHFHTRAILLGGLHEGRRRCDKSKAKNAELASDTTRSGAPAFIWKPKTMDSASERCTNRPRVLPLHCSDHEEVFRLRISARHVCTVQYGVRHVLRCSTVQYIHALLRFGV
jgi:hypothetical protein